MYVFAHSCTWNWLELIDLNYRMSTSKVDALTTWLNSNNKAHQLLICFIRAGGIYFGELFLTRFAHFLVYNYYNIFEIKCKHIFQNSIYFQNKLKLSKFLKILSKMSQFLSLVKKFIFIYTGIYIFFYFYIL